MVYRYGWIIFLYVFIVRFLGFLGWCDVWLLICLWRRINYGCLGGDRIDHRHFGLTLTINIFHIGRFPFNISQFRVVFKICIIYFYINYK